MPKLVPACSSCDDLLEAVNIRPLKKQLATVAMLLIQSFALNYLSKKL